jgi:hypothetical protein
VLHRWRTLQLFATEGLEHLHQDLKRDLLASIHGTRSATTGRLGWASAVDAYTRRLAVPGCARTNPFGHAKTRSGPNGTERAHATLSTQLKKKCISLLSPERDRMGDNGDFAGDNCVFAGAWVIRTCAHKPRWVCGHVRSLPKSLLSPDRARTGLPGRAAHDSTVMCKTNRSLFWLFR